MAYDVEQLINLQNQIGNEPVMPDALDRYAAMQNITQQGGLPSIMLAGGGVPEGAGMDFPPTTRSQKWGVPDYQWDEDQSGPVGSTQQYIDRIRHYRPKGHPKYEEPKSGWEKWKDRPHKDLDLDVKLMNWLRNLFTRETPPTKEELIEAERIKKILDSIKSEDVIKYAPQTVEGHQEGGLISILNVGGQPSIDAQVQNLASKGRYGDTMLMHVNPKEVAGLGGLTINPETGLPEAFWALLPFMAKAMIIGAGIGAGRKALGGSGSWLQNILGGAAVGSLGGTLLGPAGASVIGGPGQFLGQAATQVPAAVAGAGGIAASPIQQAAMMSGHLGAAGAGAAPVNMATIGQSLAGGADPTPYTMLGQKTTTEAPAWMEKIFTSAPWKSIEEHPYRTAATLGGVAAMLPSEQTYGDEYDLTSAAPSVSGFGPFIPKEPRELIEPLTQAQIEEGGPYNFYSKEGGLLSVINRNMGGATAGAGGWASNPYGTPTYAMGLTNRPDAMERPIGSMGDPRYTKPMSLTEWNINFGPGSEYAGEGGGDGGGAVPVVENPFQFPTVTPFQSAISDFDLESSLARIGGEPYAIPSVPVVESFPIEESVVSFPALDDLYARTAAKIDDPIVSVVAEELNKNSGGLVELAVGGVPNVFEGRVQGVGDGMADQVPFNVIPQTREDIPKTPDMALLSSDEYVVPADVVSMLGNGSSTAGAQALDKFNKLMRRKAHGTNKQQREISAGKELSSLV